MIYDVGDKINLTTQVLVGGVLTDATMAILLTLPDGTTSIPSPINHPGTGLYNVDVTATIPGNYIAKWTASGTAIGVDEYEYNVQPLGFRILGLSEVKTHLNKTGTADDNELRGFIDAAGEIVESICGPVLNRTIVEYHDGGSMEIHLRFWPIVSVTSVVETWWSQTNYTLTQETDLGVGPATGFDFTFDRNRGFITRRRSFFPWYFVPGSQNIKVTYVGGRTQPWPANIRLGALELVSWLWRNSQLGRGFPRAPVGGSQTTLIAGYSVPNPIIEILLSQSKLPPMVGTG